MISIKILWTDTEGVRHVSVCGYDEPSAQHRIRDLRAGGATDIETVKTKPGETVEVEQPRTGRIVQRKHTAVK
jgi:hypothetical protein